MQLCFDICRTTFLCWRSKDVAPCHCTVWSSSHSSTDHSRSVLQDTVLANCHLTFSQFCKGILCSYFWSVFPVLVNVFVTLLFGIVWSCNTHFLSPLVTFTSTLSSWMGPLSSKFFSEKLHRTGQHCLFVCFYNCSSVWFKRVNLNH